jgi:hypothetical protein
MPLTNDQIKIQLLQSYRGFGTSLSLDNEVKNLKRLNVIFGKLEKTEKDCYAKEIIGMLKTINNRMNIAKLRLLLYEVLEHKYHSTADYIIESIEKEL